MPTPERPQADPYSPTEGDRFFALPGAYAHGYTEVVPVPPPGVEAVADFADLDEDGNVALRWYGPYTGQPETGYCAPECLIPADSVDTICAEAASVLAAIPSAKPPAHLT